MAAAKMVSVRVDPGVLERVDVRAGLEGVSRSQWMVRALESALADDTRVGSPAGRGSAIGTREIASVAGAASARGASRPSASSRASGPVRVDSVAQAHQWALDRQARLNAAKERGS